MLQTFIIIAGIAILLLVGGILNRLAEIVKHLQDITEKTVGVTLELRQLHSDLNRTAAQAVASVSAASVAVENARTAVESLNRTLLPAVQDCASVLNAIYAAIPEPEPQEEPEPQPQEEPEPPTAEAGKTDPVAQGEAVAEAIEQ